MGITLTGRDLIRYKPHLEKTSGYDKRPTALDNYITAGITFVDNEMIVAGIDLNDSFLTDNQSYENVYLQYIYYLYTESCNIINPTKEDLDLIKIEYNKYLDMLSVFKTIYQNNNLEENEEPKSLYNNITLKFG